MEIEIFEIVDGIPSFLGVEAIGVTATGCKAGSLNLWGFGDVHERKRWR